ncbi:hypothetical protein B7P43_G10269 [Cryptotermes secundus]|uniref:Mos1 transposase HTH domain-containing protein n=1 Tax=Cryptotermes secundus TaxID=105785 RepID=A0A2J7PEC3_9NEOP|nr:hypothetical protein B7P43_G10269 [Cryptotermes secundus]
MSEQEVPRSVEQRILIKFLIGENAPSAEIHHRLQQQYGEECPSRTRVFEWCKCFRGGRERVENEPHDRRPRTSVTKPNIDRADALIRENRRITIKELGAMLSISVGSVETVKYHLHYRKVNGRWVPRTLTDVNKMMRMQAASPFLQDHARPHTAKATMETLRKLKWNLLTLPPYSPDLAPSDFYLFGRLQSDFQGMRLWTTTPSSRMFGSEYAANHKTFLKRGSGCFQNVGKNVLTPEGSTLKTHMCKCFAQFCRRDSKFGSREEERVAEGSPTRDCLAGRSSSQHHRRQHTYFRVYVVSLIETLTRALGHPLKRCFGDAEIYFQQEGAPPHYHREVRACLDTTLPDRWIGRGGSVEYLARSPDLTPMDFLLWGYLKDKVYAANPATFHELKDTVFKFQMKCFVQFHCSALSALDNDDHQFEHLRTRMVQ